MRKVLYKCIFICLLRLGHMLIIVRASSTAKTNHILTYITQPTLRMTNNNITAQCDDATHKIFRQIG